ncbi:MAG: tyrosyl-tRNA synthetase [Frankiaceae bacterium]|jgi:tyrosyl-tRNA synthetase|nr:tyrosyl-tRNA synthetase [Frankiaceae bacterium]
MPNADILDDLEWRGLVAQATEPTALREALANGPVTVYAGFDPTADSLHVGSLVPMLTLRRFQNAGHRAIALAGGATGLIGDPGGRAAERSLNDAETVAAWTERIRGQLGRLVDLDEGRLENNYEWTAGVSAIEFLRDVGKHFTVNYMLAKESVSSRLAGEGISFTEFSYMLLQAFDYRVLYDRYGCTLQVGGSDQWGNITAGIELIRRTRGAQAHGLTLPLVTSATGEKFGKSVAGAVWLDPARTSPYAFYQYWLNVDDRDAVPYLKIFTFLSRAAIEALAAEQAERPQARAAQRALAAELTRLVHGEAELAAVQQASEVLFGSGDVASLAPELLDQALAEVPRTSVARDALPALPALLVGLGLAKSASDARGRVAQGGVYVNGARASDADWQPGTADLLHGRYLVVRSGKRNYGLVTAE